jgi:hypothetical protein
MKTTPLSNAMLSVVMLKVILLSVVAPEFCHFLDFQTLHNIINDDIDFDPQKANSAHYVNIPIFMQTDILAWNFAINFADVKTAVCSFLLLQAVSQKNCR